MKQPPHPSGRVVSLRMPDEIIERLDALAKKPYRLFALMKLARNQIMLNGLKDEPEEQE